ncbi:hypothetical protein NECAME_12632 [Necator americanus]|uniref:Choline/carnitine acyltransferase domain-containing protein n=1 Tax=Necator americanus TaxID=51031 RepID=W2T023_NECAM|nr:hypothetical protein NECAME_12632 [Necator americanus]ETN74909.1 hypothetical protein NECAME_12632 [Necator americanus]
MKQKQNNGNEHILVMCRNQAYVMHTRIGGHMLPFADILFQLREVLRMSEARKDMAIPIGASAAGDRDTAAQFWNTLQEVDVNCISLTWAQEAIFVVCLDDEDKKSRPAQNWSNIQDHEKDFVARGKHILTGGGPRGHGLNRWYDATIQVLNSRKLTH